MRWTAEMDAELLKRWPNESAAEIASTMIRVSRSAVIGRHARLTGAAAKYSKKRNAALRSETAAKRARKQEIAEQVLKRFDLEKRRREAILAALEEGSNQISVAKVLGLSKQRVQQILVGL